MAKIYLVAGHGGSDPGACGCGRKEKEDTLKLTLDVGNALAKLGHAIKYNRTSDVTTDMYAYIRECNNFGADICVSIHRNSFNGSAKGYETCIYENSGKTKVLADALNAGMAALGFVNRGSKIRQDLAVLNSTTMSAALLEVGFIDNADDNDIFVKRYTDIVSLIANSILKAVGASGTVSVDTQPSTPQAPAQPSGSMVTLTGDYVNMRSDAYVGASVVDCLRKGTQVEWLSDDGWGWSQIRYNGKEGWMVNEYLTGKTLSKYKGVDIDGYNVNVRKGPGKNYGVIQQLNKGNYITCISIDPNNWMYAKINDEYAYVFYDPSYINIR